MILSFFRCLTKILGSRQLLTGGDAAEAAWPHINPVGEGTSQKAYLTGPVPFTVTPFIVAPLVAAAEHLTGAGLWEGAISLGALGTCSTDIRALLCAVGNVIESVD